MPDPDLAALLASPTLLIEFWPEAANDAMMLVHVLRTAMPSLADALAVGLLSVLAPTKGKPTTVISVRYERAVLTAKARRRSDRTEVQEPHAHPREVTWLEVTDVTIAGRSCLAVAG